MKVIEFWCTVRDDQNTNEIHGWISNLLGEQTGAFLRAYYHTESVEMHEWDYAEAENLYAGPLDILDVQKVLEDGRIAIQEYKEIIFENGHQENYSSGRQPKVADYLKKYAVQETIGGWRQTPMFTGTLPECKRFMEERCTDSRSEYAIVREDEVVVDYL